MQEQVTLELPGAPGAVRFCMGLGRPGHRSGDRATDAATVGAPRREQQPKKNFQAAAVGSPSLRVTPDTFALIYSTVVRLTPCYLRRAGSDSESGRDTETSHCPCLMHRTVFSVPSFAAESSCPCPCSSIAGRHSGLGARPLTE